MPRLTPHGCCLAWTPALPWLHVVPDAVVAASYHSIPVALGYSVLRRRDLALPGDQRARRDAGGGALVIRTASVSLDVTTTHDAAPGDYVVLRHRHRDRHDGRGAQAGV